MPLRKPDDFLKQGSKVFRRAPVDRDAIRGWVTIATGNTGLPQL
jgi:hypothetical protein